MANYIMKIVVIVFISIFIAGCSNVQSKDAKEWVGYKETGKASYYADKHQGRKTANGEVYSHKLNTAAHKTLPFGALVKVTNVENGKNVVVKVNDRGPFAKGRIIDLSKSAFSAIAQPSSGIASVRIEVIK
jgi:rare lipoprotein A